MHATSQKMHLENIYFPLLTYLKLRFARSHTYPEFHRDLCVPVFEDPAWGRI